MYLKSIEIQGFKSFADKIYLEFNPGITAVVGPNGSGKSNIADAVRWVLGEQSVKNLRGGKMEDVIFAGTDHRKPLGFAEVSITIDNSDNALPVSFSEVTVTRRIFRSGESEYFINKSQCRLKDIHELFLDTGIGRDGYSIIGQGRVEEILSSKSEERRHIFEEASGIMKYKLRKQEAEKKLELTKQNILRISDIISELEKQLEPLSRQAEDARKYLALRERLKELEVNVYIENISKYRKKIQEYQDQYSSLQENMEQERNKLERITQENKEKTDLLKNLEERLVASRQEFFGLEQRLEQIGSQIKLNEEKVNNLTQNISRIDAEIQETCAKLNNLEKDKRTKDERIKYLNERYEDYSSRLNEYQEQLNQVLASMDQTSRHIEELKSGIMDKLDILSDKKAQMGNVKLVIDNLRKRQNQLATEIYNLGIEKDREAMKKEDLTESIRQAGEVIRLTQERLDALEKEKNELEVISKDLNEKLNHVKSEIHVKSSRIKMLQDMERNLEGYNRSVKMILQACHRFPELAKGIHGALAQVISVDKKYEVAIEMSLGSALQNIVTTTEEDAKNAIEYLKKNKLGRATFLPISSVKGRYMESRLLDEIKKHPGFCGVASDLVKYKEEYKGIILSLLGRVAVVENLDAGIEMARKFGYGFRIVTLEGEILNTGGSISGGSTENREHGILSRNREISELKEELKEQVLRQESLENRLNEISGALKDIEAEIAETQSSKRETELEKIRRESQLAQVEDNIKRISSRAEMLKQERLQLQRQEEETETELKKYTEEISTLEADIETTKRVVSEYQEKNKEVQTVRDSLHRDITDFRISVNSILESLSSVKESLDRINSEMDACINAVNKKQQEKTRCLVEIQSLKEKTEGLKNEIKSINTAKSGKTFEIDRITEEKKVLEEELSSIVDIIKDINKNIMLYQEESSRIEVMKARLETEMESVQNRMWDEYELTYTNALQLKKDIGSITQAQKKINELRNEIKSLGHVNVSAIDEYVKTKERYEFMKLQLDDMKQAEEKLYRVIAEITSTMKQQFIKQFSLINENFNMVFRELFDGGHAELILSDKDNVLESGIEIEVQPPGKKLQNMMLLSGGEKALTAIALLFAILRLKPVPFCILDEIEAALDDANVQRFASYIKKYSKDTQFIIVTHRKGTMEVSDALYGVTMEERGISRIVSMKLNEQAS